MARSREFDTGKAVDAAIELFRRRGFEGVSIQEIVAATGVGRGSLYGAFGSKEGIYHAALEKYRAAYADPLTELLACDAPARDLIRQVLTGLVDEIVGDRSQHACLVVSAAVEMAGRDAEVAGRLRSTTRQLEDGFTALLSRAQREGEITLAGTPRDLARFIMMTIHGLRVLGAISPDRRSLMSTVEVVLAAL